LAGITPAELAAIRGRLEAFADDIFESLPRKDQRARGSCYLRGLMLDGRRKSIEPMAQRLGEVHYQALHHFVAVSPWDWRPVRRRLAEQLVAQLQPTAWAVDDTGFPKDGTHSVGCSASTAGRWARRPTASWACRSTPSPRLPAARWTGGCFCPSPGRTTCRGGRPATCPSGCGTGPNGSWCWICWMSWTSGVFARRYWSPTLATARWVSSARDWMIARSAMWCRSRRTPAPTPSRCTRPRRRTGGVVAVPGRGIATSRPRSSSSPWRPGRRPASS
jgi:hypothetical protein